MTDTKVMGNKRVLVLVGPATGIDDWDAPTIAELDALEDVTGAINWDSFDLNVQASDTQDDRTLDDAAGAKSRGTTNFGGNLEFVNPTPADTASIYRVAYNLFKGDRQQLAVAIRVGPLRSEAIAAGDVFNTYHVLADSQSTIRATDSKPSYAYKVALKPQDDVGVNCIVPSATPTKVTLTPATTGTATVGTNEFLKAVYEGKNVTIGAAYVSSDPSIALVTPHGVVIPLAAGTASVTASYPGSAAGTATVYTVSA